MDQIRLCIEKKVLQLHKAHNNTKYTGMEAIAFIYSLDSWELEF